MKILKKLFVGSIFLLMLTTSLLVTASANENTNSSPIANSDENSLGTLVCRHNPLRALRGDLGLKGEYYPPEDNPYYIYEFPEDENGYVYMNFTLHVTHHLNPIWTYWLSYIFPDTHRWTGIELWITTDGVDYCQVKNTTVCSGFTPENYTIHFTADVAFFTDGENKTLTPGFWLNAWPGLTNIPIIRDEISRNVLFDHVYDGHITVCPVQ